jgi:hypothetical protein
MSPLDWYTCLREIAAMAVHHEWSTDAMTLLMARYTVKFAVVLRARQEDLPQIARALWKRPSRRH